MTGSSTTWRVARSVFVCAVLVGGCLFAYMRAAQGGVAIDYLAFATGGRVVATDPHHLYDIARQADAQAALLGYRPDGPAFPSVFANPPFVAELIRPLAFSGLQWGTDVFCGLLFAALGATAVLLGGRLPRAISAADRWAFACLAGVSTAGAYGILLGQWSPLLALAAVVALLLLDRGRVFLAGVVLAFLLVKPQIVWLLVPGLAITRRWRLLGGFGAGAAVLAALSVAVVGLDGTVTYLNFLRDYATAPAALTGRSLPDVIGRYIDTPSVIPLLTAVGGVLALAGVAIWRDALSADGPAIAVLLLLSLLTSGHTNPQDFALLGMTAAVFVQRCPRQVVGLLVALNVGVALAVMNWNIPLDVVTLLTAVALLARHGVRRTVVAPA